MTPLIRIALVAISLALALTVGCAKRDAAVDEVAQTLENQDKLVEIQIFYPSAELIVEDPREVEKSKLGPEEAVKQIFETQRGGKKLDPVMPSTKIIGVRVDSGIATVNFERSVLNFPAPELNQQLVVAAIAKTLAQFPEVKQLKFQVEGLDKGVIDGKDVENFWGSVTLKDQPWNVR